MEKQTKGTRIANLAMKLPLIQQAANFKWCSCIMEFNRFKCAEDFCQHCSENSREKQIYIVSMHKNKQKWPKWFLKRLNLNSSWENFYFGPWPWLYHYAMKLDVTDCLNQSASPTQLILKALLERRSFGTAPCSHNWKAMQIQICKVRHWMNKKMIYTSTEPHFIKKGTQRHYSFKFKWYYKIYFWTYINKTYVNIVNTEII